jgi:cytolysin-activating lysine-acyltransferase
MSKDYPNPTDGSAVFPIPDVIGVYGALAFLAARCPLHGRYSAAQLNQWFMPAVEHNCVRLFQNADGIPCAALIWARLSPEVSGRMLKANAAPGPEDWVSGNELWFMDILAPFGHGGIVARHIARNPPAEAFGFARVGADGRIRKIIRVPRTANKVGRRMQAEILAVAMNG